MKYLVLIKRFGNGDWQNAGIVEANFAIGAATKVAAKLGWNITDVVAFVNGGCTVQNYYEKMWFSPIEDSWYLNNGTDSELLALEVESLLKQISEVLGG